MQLAKRADQRDGQIGRVGHQRQRARFQPTRRLQQLPRVALATEHMPRHAEETQAQFGRFDTARPAFEQFDPVILLQPPHVIRHRRLRQRQRLRRFGKPAMFRDRMKRPQLRVLHVCLASMTEISFCDIAIDYIDFTDGRPFGTVSRIDIAISE